MPAEIKIPRAPAVKTRLSGFRSRNRQSGTRLSLLKWSQKWAQFTTRNTFGRSIVLLRSMFNAICNADNALSKRAT